VSIRYDHTGIVVDTAEHNAEVAAFFANVLGLRVEGDAGGGYAEVVGGGPVIALHAGGDGRADLGRHGGTLLQMTSDDVDADLQAISGRGGQILVEAEDLPWGRSAYIAGPHGVVVELYQPGRASADRSR